MRSFSIVGIFAAIVCSVAVFGCKKSSKSKETKAKEDLFNEAFPKFVQLSGSMEGKAAFVAYLKSMDGNKMKIVEEWVAKPVEESIKQYLPLVKPVLEKCAKEHTDAAIKMFCADALNTPAEDFDKGASEAVTEFFTSVHNAFPKQTQQNQS